MNALTYPLAGQKTIVQPERRIPSPAFAVSYPNIRNLDLIDPGARASMEESWAKGAFAERDIEIFNLSGAYFIDECLILNDELQVIANASDEYTDEEIERAVADIRLRLEANDLPHYAGVGIIAKRRAVNNYGHFLMEMLPMAHIARSIYGHRDPRYILHRVEPPMLDVSLRSLRLLGVAPDRLLIKDFREPIRFENLVIVRGLTKHGTYMSPLCTASVAGLGKGIPKGTDRRIFVRRVAGWRRGRTLLNEDEVCTRLTAKGFAVVDPKAMTLEQQIATFSGAEHVVGAAGAAMTNIVFCRPGTQVTSLVPARFSDTFFWFIATHKGLRYSEVRGDQLPDEYPEASTGDFRIRDSDIEYLEGIGSDPDTISHVHEVGDIACRLGEWIGIPGSGLWLEGFSIRGPEGIEIQYQAVLERNWMSRWFGNGEFCGSRGMSLPLHGVRVWAAGRLASDYECICNATFVDGTRRLEVSSSETCVAESLSPLEAFQVVLRPKGPG